jgi:hypothetical protein
MICENVAHKSALVGRGSSPCRELAGSHSEKLNPFPGMRSPASWRSIAAHFVRFRTA